MANVTGKMQFGLLLRFGQHYAPEGREIHWPELRQLAKLSEDVGFDTLWVDDHFLMATAGESPETEGKLRGVWDCWSLLAALSEATSRVTLGPFVTCTSYRNPALLAKIADTIEDISGGRLLLGVGAGWNEPEYTAFGFPYDHLASRFEESLQIIVPLLRDGYVDFVGKYYQARELELKPRGPRPKGPPIWIGAKGPRMLRLVAQYADAFNGVWHTNPAELTARFEQVDAACRELGRDPETLLHTGGTYIALPGPDGQVASQRVATIKGSVDEMIERIHAYAPTGVKHLTFSLEPWSPVGIERAGRVIEGVRKLL